MRRDAKEHEEEDRRKREEIETRNQADAMIFQGEKQLKEFESKLDQNTRSKIQAAIDRLKEAVKGNNITEIKSAMEQYNIAWNEASQQMYAQAKSQTYDTAGQQQTQSSGQKPDDGKVENADFEVVDDKK
jgi:molecular chaperone DnaK